MVNPSAQKMIYDTRVWWLFSLKDLGDNRVKLHVEEISIMVIEKQKQLVKILIVANWIIISMI